MKNYKNIQTDYASSRTVTKRYSQKTSGSAYYKVCSQLLTLVQSGIHIITVIYNGDKRWEKQYKEQVDLAQEFAPYALINFATEYK